MFTVIWCIPMAGLLVSEYIAPVAGLRVKLDDGSELLSASENKHQEKQKSVMQLLYHLLFIGGTIT